MSCLSCMLRVATRLSFALHRYSNQSLFYDGRDAFISRSQPHCSHTTTSLLCRIARKHCVQSRTVLQFRYIRSSCSCTISCTKRDYSYRPSSASVWQGKASYKMHSQSLKRSHKMLKAAAKLSAMPTCSACVLGYLNKTTGVGFHLLFDVGRY